MKRIISAIMILVTLVSIVSTSFAADYLLPKKLREDPEFIRDINQGYQLMPGTVTGYANLWFLYEGGADGEAWPEEYLAVFDEYTKECALGNEGLTLYGYEWDYDRLVVDFGVTFDVKYYWHVGIGYTELYGPTLDDYTDISTNGLLLTVRDRESGELLRVVADKTGIFVPELRYEKYNSYAGNDYQFLSLEEAKAFEEANEMELAYTSECRKAAEFTLPEDFDPETQELALHYMTGEKIFAVLDDPSEFSDPYAISLDGYKVGPVVSTGPDDIPELSFTFASSVPEDYLRHFERLLEKPSTDETLAVKMSNPGFAYDIFTAHLTRAADRVDLYSPKSRNAMQIVAVRDKEQKNILSLRTSEWADYQATTMIIAGFLPSYFDPALHEVIAFNYAIDYSAEGAPEHIAGEPLVIEYDKYIFGDADKNGVVNLSDVTLMLKEIAHWDTVKTEAPDEWNYQPYSTMDASAILKIIAGWDRRHIFEESDMMSCGLRIGTSAAVRYCIEK